MGPGMMGGGGMMGPGGGMGALWHLDLTDAQRQQVLKIQDDLRRKNWDLLGKQQDEQAKLRDAYFGSAKRDRAAVIAAYKRISDLRVQRIENSLDAAEKIEGVLTQQQRDQLKRWGPWWMSGGEQ
jgi:Spy/CpxP family protein refolding chaperone